mgnify:FL=1
MLDTLNSVSLIICIGNIPCLPGCSCTYAESHWFLTPMWRFTHREALTAFAGVDPGVDESGQHKSKSNRASKVGSARLRKTLFQIMTTLLQNAPEADPVYRFLDKKRSQGKPYYVYMTAGANKFLRIYYGKVKECLRNLEQTE